MRCVKKLRPGFYPSLKNPGDTAITDENLFHTAAEPCNPECRTCKISHDFTMGMPDHCTSCKSEGNTILSLVDPIPTCVPEQPPATALVIIKNNKFLGVSGEFNEYGATDENGDLIDGVDMDVYESNYENTGNYTSFTCEPDDTDCLDALANLPTGADNSTMPPPEEETEMTPEEEMAWVKRLYKVGWEFHLPSIATIIDKAEIDGIGWDEAEEETCVASLGENRRPRNVEPDVIFLAIPCPEDCEECMVTKNGLLACTRAAAGSFVVDGRVDSMCPVEGYLEDGDMCITCPRFYGIQCTACEKQPGPSGEELVCTGCPMGHDVATIDDNSTTFTACVSQVECESNQYYDGSSCMECSPGCGLCLGATCAFCADDFYMNVLPDGSRECLAECPAAHYPNEFDKCTKCHDDCATCWGPGKRNCLTCQDPAHFLRPTQLLRIDRENEESVYDLFSGNSPFAFEYELPEGVPDKFGECVPECKMPGFALYPDSEGVCRPCGEFGCTECDQATGECIKCDQRMRLSLVDNEIDTTDPRLDPGSPMYDPMFMPPTKICEECQLLHYGCRICEDEDPMSCAMCEFPYSLIQDEDTGKMMCTERCPAGSFSMEVEADEMSVPKLMKDRRHSVCAPCEGDCEECMGDANKCLKCSDPMKVAKRDGSCADNCDTGSYNKNGRCKKCGQNIAACAVDPGTGVFSISSCEPGFFLNAKGTACVSEFKCGKGYYGNTTSNSCAECDGSQCTQCKGAADFCTECKDRNKLVSNDGNCYDDKVDVTCDVGTYKSASGVCKPCDSRCDPATGCDGKGETKCLKCADGFLSLAKIEPTGGTTTYKCGKKCPALAEVIQQDGQDTCKKCSTYNPPKRYNIATGECVDASIDCPLGTVLMDLDKVPLSVDSSAQTFTGNSTGVKVCAPCHSDCGTCSPDDPWNCLTCASHLFANHYSYDYNGTTHEWTECKEKCDKGTFSTDGMTCDGTCLDNCARCSNATTCDRCMYGFFKDSMTDSPNDRCIDDWTTGMECPPMTFADKNKRECLPCSADCTACEYESEYCTECPAGKLWISATGECTDTCPQGTYANGTTCDKCQGNILNCDPTTGMFMGNPEDMEHCAMNCDGCTINQNFCIDCAMGYFPAPDGRCVMECPAGTYLEEAGGMPFCKKCGDGCTKCILEPAQCFDEFGGYLGDDQIMMGEMTNKCIRCDTKLDLYLFQDICVEDCPHGTFKDDITGWCVQCPCDCGTGGCVDGNTCATCTSPGTVLDKDSGKCVCDTDVTAQWADDWESFTITIDSDKVKFRDLEAELYSGYDYSMKTCFIGNEPPFLKEDYFDNYYNESAGSDFGNGTMGMGNGTETLGNNTGGIPEYSTNHTAGFEDIPLGLCGDWAAREAELMHIYMEFGAIDIDYTSNQDTGYPGMGHGMGDSYGMDGSYGMGNDTMGMGNDTTGMNNDTMGIDYDYEYAMNHTYHITDESGECPAHAETFSYEELNKMGIYSQDDVLHYMASIGRTFGEISDEDLEYVPNPLEGLQFTNEPMALCELIFDEYTLMHLGYPECTVTVADGKTHITVSVGEQASISTGMEVKFNPNVFVEGCEFPVLDWVEIMDGPVREELEIEFDHDNEVTVCSDLFLTVLTEGNIGEVGCHVRLEGAYDGTHVLIDTPLAIEINSMIVEQNSYFDGSGFFQIWMDQLQLLTSEGAEYLIIEAYCYDSYGQEQFIYQGFNLVAQSSEVTLAYDWEYIVYDTNYGEYIFLEFEYADCSGTNGEVTYTTELQVQTGPDTWVMATGAGEEIINNEFIPSGLSIDSVYRVFVVATAPGVTAPSEFYLRLEMIVPEPWIILDDFSSFLPVTQNLSYTFDQDHFINVDNISDATLSFECLSCDDSECVGQAGILDFNSLYDEMSKTIDVPENTLAENSCYILEVSVSYRGLVGTNVGFIITADSTVDGTYEVELSVQDGEYVNFKKAGKIECDFDYEENISREQTTSVIFDLYDSSGNSLVGNGGCATLNGQVIRYTRGCLQPNEIYQAECELTADVSGGVGKGKRIVQFNTVTTLSTTANISPNTGTKFTKFTIDMTLTHDYAAVCFLAYYNPDHDGYTFTNKEYKVPANGAFQIKDVKLPQLSVSNGNVEYTLYCESQVTDDYAFTDLSVTINPYTGTDEATQQQAEVDNFVNTMDGTNFSSGGTGSGSATASNAIGEAMGASAGFAAADESTSTRIVDFICEAIALLDFDQEDSLTSIAINAIIALEEVIDNGISPDAAENLFDGVEGMMTGQTSGRRLQESGSDKDRVRGIAPSKEETVLQLDGNTCTSLSYALSTIANAISNSQSMTSNEIELNKRRLLNAYSQLTKACLHNLPEGETFEIPAEEIFFHVERIGKDATSQSTDIKYEFPCPCSNDYAFTAAASSSAANGGSASTTGSTAATASGETSSNEGNCYVNIPAFNKADVDTSTCNSFGVTVIATKNACPGTESASSDSTSAQDSFTFIDLEVAGNSTYNETSYTVTEGSCSTSDFSNMQCTGPSLEVSYYCLKGKRPDSKGRRLAEKLDVKNFKDNAAISYKIGCTSDTNTTGTEQTPVFLDESTGLNSCTGCSTDSVTGNQQCAHTTSFGYSSSVRRGGGKDFTARVFEDYIFYFMLVIDIYFIAVFIFALLQKTQKQEIAVQDNSKAMEDYHMKNGTQKVDVASSFQGEIRNSQSEDDIKSNNDDIELHKAGFFHKLWIGIILKWRVITPFTTSHPNLTRLNRGIINCLVVYFMWVISGVLLLLIEKIGWSYLACVPICFIIARALTFAFEILHKTGNSKAIEILSYCLAGALAVVLHVSVFLLTNEMDGEFGNWNHLTTVVLFIDLIIWELVSLIAQNYIGTKLASSPDSFAGKRQSMEKLVTPPLLKKYIDP